MSFEDEINQEEAIAIANVAKSIAELKIKGCPIAKFDTQLKLHYLEYPDGRREYVPSEISLLT